MRRILAFLAAAWIVAACDSSAPTSTQLVSPMHFLSLASNAPPLANAADSFWAFSSKDARVAIYFRPAAGATDSAKLLQFRVPALALYRRPDGSSFGPQDSVLIHVNVVDPTKMIVAFSPSGLQFSPSNPAELRFDFGEANPDLNHDGDVDAADDALKSALHLWRQAQAGQAWSMLPGVVDVSIDEVEAEIFGFSNYALAY